MRTRLLAGFFGGLLVWTPAASKGLALPLNPEPRSEAQRYERALDQLRAELLEALPAIPKSKRTAYHAALEREISSQAALKKAEDKMGAIDKAKGLVGHAKGKWIGGADKGIAAANAQLEKATTASERRAAQEELEKWQKNREDGEAALVERQAALDGLLKELPQFERELDLAKQHLIEAKHQTKHAVKSLGLDSFLSQDQLDRRLAKFIVLSEATPIALATFANRSGHEKQIVERLLADEELMLSMVMADGAEQGRYEEAAKILMSIQEKSTHSQSGVLRRLALAIALEHAVPISQRNPVGLEDAPEHVDPVNRYLHYEKAFLEGALDPCFEHLSAWDLRMVVDGNEPDEILGWGREMLHNYRPDHIYTSDYKWRYVAAVRTDCKYGSQDNKYDKPELQFFQNILMNGGVCGRRAFFGRFILRSFGVPTTARPQRGHASLAHWTPEGWVICLGGGWGTGWANCPNKWPGRPNKRNSDLDFLAITQARASGEAYMEVKRAQWIGDLMGETRIQGLRSGDPDLWYAVSFYRQQEIIDQAGTVTLAAVGEELGEANESSVQYAVESSIVTEADRDIQLDDDGSITIPAVACSEPQQSTRKILFMPSNLGGKQLHYNRVGKPEEFSYSFEAPESGKYTLKARVVTPSWKQSLRLAVNDSNASVEMALPFTVGMWESTEPVEIELKQGRNVLRFSRDESVKGVTIKDFTLTPLN